MTKRSIMQTMPHSSPGTLADKKFWRNFNGFTPTGVPNASELGENWPLYHQCFDVGWAAGRSSDL